MEDKKIKNSAEKKSRNVKRNLIILLAAAVIISGLSSFTNLFYSADASLQDTLCQQQQLQTGDVVLINIDSAALNEYGNLPWNRSVYADLISALNADPDARPAAIGIDVVFAGYSADEEADKALYEACKAGGNVVVAADAVFGNDIITVGEGFSLTDEAVMAWDKPFPELCEFARFGHINAVFDSDGTLRHMRQYVDVDGNRYQSFGREVYEQYCESLGIEPNPQPARPGDTPYVRFSGLPGDFSESISVYDVLSGNITGDYFEDCVVLIGPYDATLQDNYRTASAHDENMFGVEFQANIIQSYIDDAWPIEMDGKTSDIITIAAALVLAVIFALFGLKLIIVLWVIFAPGWMLLCKLLAGGGTILHPLYIPVVATVLAVTAIALHYITAALEKRRITGVFSRYVAPGVVKELLKEDESALGLGGKNVDVAVLFVDIRGFTTMSESMEPEQVVAILNDYLQLTTDCVMKNEGTLDKFVGDCTMAFWNAPLSQEDYIYKACRAAMDMVEGSIALTDELEKKFGKRVGFGVGVHCGPAVIGNIGAKQRMDFTAIGDTVNTASRLESNAPASTVYISRAVADALGDRAKTTSLGGSIKLKGKAEGFEVLILDELI